MKLKSSQSEAEIQMMVVEWLRLHEAVGGYLFFSVPNEGMDRANPARLAKLKRMGLRPGVSDLVIVKDGQAHFLEIKKPGGKRSVGQVDFAADCMIAGSKYGLAWSYDEAINILQKWLL